ncbi:hypothetical protein [Pseudomonas syringae group genomosp. 7]|uniref:hypothetical protein n=1 Tax=Pseudomonas syringae group genomosp. 7 TaxID=251699 RepID=UPI00376F61A5
MVCLVVCWCCWGGCCWCFFWGWGGWWCVLGCGFVVGGGWLWLGLGFCWGWGVWCLGFFC